MLTTKNIFFVTMLIFVYLLTSCKSQKELTEAKAKKTSAEYNKIKFESILIAASKEKMLGNFQESMVLYTECLNLDENSGVSLFEVSKLFEYYKDIEAALKMGIAAVKASPENKWYKLHLAELYKKTGQETEVIEIYEKLILQFPEESEYQYELANMYIKSEKNDKALEILNRIEHVNDVSVAVTIAKVKIYEKRGEKNKLFKELNNLIHTFPDEFKYKLLLAEYYIKYQEEDKALKIFLELENLYPNNGIVQMSLGTFYYQNGKTEEAYRIFKKVFRSPDVSLKIKISILIMDYSFFEPVQKEKAFNLINILNEVYPNDNRVTALYAEYYMKNMHFKEAGEQLRKIMDEEKHSYLYWEKLLAIDIELGDFRSLRSDSEKALEFFPNHAEFYLYNGIASYNVGEYTAAIDVLVTGLDYVINNIDIEVQFYTFLGEAYYKIELFDKSFAAFDKVIKISPKDILVLNNYSYYLALQEKNLDKALLLIEKCISLEPENSTFLDTYAWVLFCNKSYEEALPVIEKSLKFGGKSNAVIVEHYGDILFKLNREADAISQWKKAVQIGKGTDLLDEKIKQGKYIE